MHVLPVIAIFDIGKTNKKFLLFDAQYNVVYEHATQCKDIADEGGFPCEDISQLSMFVYEMLRSVTEKGSFQVKAINFAAYGASFVYIDANGKPVLPLYNYLKPYPEALQQQLYDKYGGSTKFAIATSSPILGSLNSGLQLYRIKEEQPETFGRITYALHLPQYLSYLVTGMACSDITSIGCHTALWDFGQSRYHEWAEKENILSKLAPIYATDKAIPVLQYNTGTVAGIGLHDSSAALIPYHSQFEDPFVLISTGTWCISLNPFNNLPLTPEELALDCLCYLDYKGRQVKASRLLMGAQYDEGVAAISHHFNRHGDFYQGLLFDVGIATALNVAAAQIPFKDALHNFKNDTEAYHYLLLQLVKQQYRSTNLVLQNSNVKQIFVDGGFSKNNIYMNLLAAHFPDKKVYAASMAQGTALGAALAIHHTWQQAPLPAQTVNLRLYKCTCDLTS